MTFLPPANEVCKGYVFTRVYQSFCSRGSVHGQGACVGGRACMEGGVAWSGVRCWGACVAAGVHAMHVPPELILRDMVSQ